MYASRRSLFALSTEGKEGKVGREGKYGFQLDFLLRILGDGFYGSLVVLHGVRSN